MADSRQCRLIEIIWTILASLLLFGIVGPPNALGQTTQPQLVFETAVVKAYSDGNVGCWMGPGMLQMTCYGTVPELTAESLGLFRFQFQKSGPDNNITAKLSSPATYPQRQEMLRNLLADNFKVLYHLEKREMAARFLSVAYPELLAKTSEAPTVEEFSPSGETIARMHRTTLPNGDVRFELKYASHHELAELFSVFRLWGGVVVDESQTAKKFDFVFFMRAPLQGSGDGTQWDDSDLVDLLKRSGIRATYRKGMVDFLIIDHVAPDSAFLN